VYRKLGTTKQALLEQGIVLFSMEKKTKILNWGKGFLARHRIISAVRRADFVSDRVSYMVLRGRWCNITVRNAHAPTEEKSDDSKDSVYQKLEQIFDHFPKYNTTILLGDFNANVGREYFQTDNWGLESRSRE